VKSGKEYFEDGVLNFQTEPVFKHYQKGRELRADGSYRTVFGPSTSHNGVIYENNDDNMSLAFTRLTAARFPDTPGKHEYYKVQQRAFIIAHSKHLDKIRQSYEPHFTYYSGAETEARKHHSDPHEKKNIRIQAWEELKANGTVFDRLWLKLVKYKMKKNEIAKPGKVPRTIGDLGVAASLQGFRLTKFLKSAQAAEPIDYLDGEIEFIQSPDPFKLEEVFSKLIEPPGRYYMALFSDDSCFSIRTPTGVHVYNVDISKCDASHSDCLFDAIVQVTPSVAQHDMTVLTEQCGLPIHLQSVADKAKSVLLQPKTRMLYSGSTLTTSINNLANQLIGMSFAECDYTGPESLMAAAAKVGYVVTLEACHQMEDIQFLKHSPVFDTHGRMRPLMNLGVLLRLSGTCNGDLPGRGDLRARAESFQASLLSGAYPYADFTILQNLKRHAGTANVQTDKVVADLFQYKTLRNGYEQYLVDPDSMYRRYALTPLEQSDLEDGFANLGYEGVFGGDAFNKVLGKDYGLSSLEES